MLSSKQLHLYRETRAKEVPAKRALDIARYVTTDYPWTGKVATQWDEDPDPESDGFMVPEYPGLVFTARLKDDDHNDYSHLGKFCEDDAGWSEHSMGTYLKCPGASGRREGRGGRTFTWFEPAQSVRDRARELIAMKIPRRDAWEMSWRCAKEDMKEAVEYRACGVIVTAYFEGTEVGSSSLWGVDDDKYAATSCIAEGVLAEAAREALGQVEAIRAGAEAVRQAEIIRTPRRTGARALDFN